MTKNEKITLNLFHIGGGGLDIGPAEALFKLSNIHINLYLFELRGSEESRVAVSKIESMPGIDVFKVPMGISNFEKSAKFNVNKFPLSSSLYEPSLLTSADCPNFSGLVDGISTPVRTWGENTSLDRQIDVSLTDLDSLIQNGVVPEPDFLSMDIQGGEFDALTGAQGALDRSILGIVTEVEFFEIYKNQPLYHDQARVLDEFSFRLIDIPAFQKWFPGPAIGKGFATVAEPIFIKFAQEATSGNYGKRVPADLSKFPVEKIIKLALISFAFQRYSYFYTLLNFLKVNRASDFSEYSHSPKLQKYFSIYQRIDSSLFKTKSNPVYLLENSNAVLGSRKVKFYLLLGRIIGQLKIQRVLQKIEIESRKGDYFKF